MRTILYCKTHSRPPSQNPSPEPFPEPSQNPSWNVVLPYDPLGVHPSEQLRKSAGERHLDSAAGLKTFRQRLLTCFELSLRCFVLELLAQVVCRSLSRIFVVQILEDFARDFPGGFIWALCFLQRIRNPRTHPKFRNRKKSTAFTRTSSKSSSEPLPSSGKNTLCTHTGQD